MPSYLLEPVIVDKTNYQKVLVDSGYYSETDLKLTQRRPVVPGRPAGSAGFAGTKPEMAMTDTILQMRGITKTLPRRQGAPGRQPRPCAAARSTRSAVRTAPASRR